jgi:hypothetical protein
MLAHHSNAVSPHASGVSQSWARTATPSLRAARTGIWHTGEARPTARLVSGPILPSNPAA